MGDSDKIKLSERLRERPLVAVMLFAGSIAAAGLSVLAFGAKIDALNVTEFELKERFYVHEQRAHDASVQADKTAADEREEIRRESRCQTLEIQISIIEQQIWSMETTNDNSQRLVEKRRELKRKEDKREALRCGDFA